MSDDLPPAGPDWSKGALVLASGDIPEGETRPVVVVESRDDDGKLVERTYPRDGALYFRTTPDVDFAADPTKPLLTLGETVVQGGFSGFSGLRGVVHVGPAHPAYAGVNLAYVEGARQIEVRGLSDAQKAKIAPWFAKLGDAATVTLT